MMPETDGSTLMCWRETGSGSLPMCKTVMITAIRPQAPESSQGLPESAPSKCLMGVSPLHDVLSSEVEKSGGVSLQSPQSSWVMR